MGMGIGRPRIHADNAAKHRAYRQRFKAEYDRVRRIAEKKNVCLSSDRSDWATPFDRFQEWDHEFYFSLDPCASDDSAKCERYFTKAEDGLIQDWRGEAVFMNPPYGPTGGVDKWLCKGWESAQAGATVVALVPPRTSTLYWHAWVEGKAQIRGVKRKIKFVGAPNAAAFHSVLVIYYPPFRSRSANCLCGLPHQITCHACQVALCEACYGMGKGFCMRCCQRQATKSCRWRMDAQDALGRALASP
jgi:site-specific DNA-methyltransferase (adenine-specific)